MLYATGLLYEPRLWLFFFPTSPTWCHDMSYPDSAASKVSCSSAGRPLGDLTATPLLFLMGRKDLLTNLTDWFISGGPLYMLFLHNTFSIFFICHIGSGSTNLPPFPKTRYAALPGLMDGWEGWNYLKCSANILTYIKMRVINPGGR